MHGACVTKDTRGILTTQDVSQFLNPQDPNVQRTVSVPANLLASMKFVRTRAPLFDPVVRIQSVR